MMSMDFFDGIYLHRDYVDMRKSINGLSQIVAEEMELDVFGRYLFVFINRGRNKLKMLYWDKTGFALWYKRLEKARFRWPQDYDEEVFKVVSDQLQLLLSGVDIFQKPHEILHFREVS